MEDTSFSENTMRKACHELWIRIKALHCVLDCLGYNYDLGNNDENNDEFWILVERYVRNILEYIEKSNAIISVLNYYKYSKDVVFEKIWSNYERLIDCLLKLLLAKDNNIILDYDSFIKSLCENLDLFENTLKKKILS